MNQGSVEPRTQESAMALAQRQFKEPEHEAAIDVLQGSIEGNSGGLSVKGYVELEAADGTVYELRNRYVLCRCGKSSNKPFCDATHVISQFADK